MTVEILFIVNGLNKRIPRSSVFRSLDPYLRRRHVILGRMMHRVLIRYRRTRASTLARRRSTRAANQRRRPYICTRERKPLASTPRINSAAAANSYISARRACLVRAASWRLPRNNVSLLGNFATLSVKRSDAGLL